MRSAAPGPVREGAHLLFSGRAERAKSRSWLGLFALLVFNSILICPCQGQVMAVTEGGAVAVYDGPSVFTDTGAAAIRPGQQSEASTLHNRLAEPGEALTQAANDVDLSPALLAAVAWRESRFRTDKRSSAGAIGEMQLMPSTARDLGVDATRPDQNLRGGAIYLRTLISRYNGDLTRALAAYNAGPGAVDRFGGPPPFKETQAYVAAILDSLSEVALARDGGLKQVAAKSIGAGDR